MMCIGLIALAELGDKTMLTTIALVLRYGALVSLTISITAFTISTIIVAFNANIIASYIPKVIINIAASTAFILLGLLMIRDLLRHEELKSNVSDVKYLTMLLLLIIAELGDKTQLSVFSLSVSLGLVPTIIGGIIGYSLVNILVAMFFRTLKPRLSLKYVMFLSALLFISIGIYMLLTSLIS